MQIQALDSLGWHWDLVTIVIKAYDVGSCPANRWGILCREFIVGAFCSPLAMANWPRMLHTLYIAIRLRDCQQLSIFSHLGSLAAPLEPYASFSLRKAEYPSSEESTPSATKLRTLGLMLRSLDAEFSISRHMPVHFLASSSRNECGNVEGLRCRDVCSFLCILLKNG